MKTKTKSLPQRKNHKTMTEQELEKKIMDNYNKVHPQPTLVDNLNKQLK